MRLRRLEWGSGPRTVVLVHGYTDDADTWWQIGPALAELGWHVIAPDLRGHGLSPRADSYSVDAFVEDLIDSIDPGTDLVVGHSLGAALVNLAGDRLPAKQVMLVDPPWGHLPADRTRLPWERTFAQIRDLEPTWSEADVLTDLLSNQRLDPAVTTWLGGSDPLGGRPLPLAPALPSVLVVPEDSELVPFTLYEGLLALGFTIRTVPNVGHVVHRDDPAAFVSVVNAELLASVSA